MNLALRRAVLLPFPPTMKKPASLVVALLTSVSLLVTGCASAPQSKPVAQNELARKDIEKITRVEIFYHPAHYGVMDLGGSGAAGMSGAFGIFGLMAGLALHANSKLTVVERTEARSKEFTALLKDKGTPDVNAAQAEYLAELIRKSGREVILTSVKRPTGETPLMDVTTASSSDAATAVPVALNQPGTARLILRLTSAYGAESATSSYQSLMITDAVLRDASGKRLVSMELTKKDNGETYSTFESLKANADEAALSLNKDAVEQAQQVFHNTFDLPPLNTTVAAK